MPAYTKSRKATRPSPRILLLDNYDSFTYNLYDYLLRLGATCEVIRNDAMNLDEIQACFTFDAVVLSPGPCKPAAAGIMPALIEYFHDKVPILGICLGHQGIGEFFGARLIKAAVPMHGKTSLIYPAGQHYLWKDLPAPFEAMRYHSLLLEDLEDTDLDCIARSEAGEIMALAHRRYPVTGVQFHPESILTEYGLKILENWVSGIGY